ncbi:hypothetical protein CGRA01v4_13889 [Colletotrichum graminicola]|nr:hypothetical protein CGRA01v4_13889 [Colletotrichum graminicola]
MRCWGVWWNELGAVGLSALSFNESADTISVSFAMSCTTYQHPSHLHRNSKPPAVIHIAAALRSSVSRAAQNVTLCVVAPYITMKTVCVNARRTAPSESRGQDSSAGTEQRIPTGKKFCSMRVNPGRGWSPSTERGKKKKTTNAGPGRCAHPPKFR